MTHNRRQFLISMASASMAKPLSASRGRAETTSQSQPSAEDKQSFQVAPRSEGECRRKRAPERFLDVALFSDVEDIFSPPELGNDDSIKQLATILTEEGLRANFLVIGDRALVLKERGRQDVIDSLGPHVVGLHTRSARHPTGP